MASQLLATLQQLGLTKASPTTLGMTKPFEGEKVATFIFIVEWNSIVIIQKEDIQTICTNYADNVKYCGKQIMGQIFM